MRKINIIKVEKVQDVHDVANLICEPIYWLDELVGLGYGAANELVAASSRGGLRQTVNRLPHLRAFNAIGGEYLSYRPVAEGLDDHINVWTTKDSGKAMFTANSYWEYTNNELVAKRLPNHLRTPETPTWGVKLWTDINVSTRVKEWREYIRSWFVDDFLGLPLTESEPVQENDRQWTKPTRLYWLDQSNPVMDALVTVSEYPFRSLLSTKEFLEFWPGAEDTREPPTPVDTFVFIRKLARKLRNEGHSDYNWYLEVIPYRNDWFILLDGKWVECNALKYTLANEFDVVVDTSTPGKLGVVKHRQIGQHWLSLNPSGALMRKTTVCPNQTDPGLVNLALAELNVFYRTNSLLAKMAATGEIPVEPLFSEYLDRDTNWLEAYSNWLGLKVAVTFKAEYTDHLQAVLVCDTTCNYRHANKRDTYHFDLASAYWNDGKNYFVDLSGVELPEEE